MTFYKNEARMKLICFVISLLFSLQIFAAGEKKVLIDGRFFNVNLSESDRWLEWNDDVPLNLGSVNINSIDRTLNFSLKVIDPVKVPKNLGLNVYGSCILKFKDVVSGIPGRDSSVVYDVKLELRTIGKNFCEFKVRYYQDIKILVNVVNKEEM